MKRGLLLLTTLTAATNAQADWPPTWTFGDGWQLTPSASLQYDALHADTDEGDLDIDGFRRQRAALTLVSPSKHSLKLDYDLAAGSWADLFVRVDLGESGAIRAGQIKTPIGLEVLTSHRAISYFERSPASVLLPGRRLGVEWSRATDAGTVTIAAIDDNIDRAALGHGVFGRATRQFGADPDGTRVHVGLGGGVEWPDSAPRFRGRPDVSGLPLSLADSGVLDDVERLDRVAAEVAVDRGAFSVQGEHVELRGHRDDGDFSARGTYLGVSWRATGEARRYRNGIFDTLQPTGDWGALELVARLSNLDVPVPDDDRDASGRSLSGGINWYITGQLKLMAQATAARPDNDTFDRIYGIRLHYLF